MNICGIVAEYNPFHNGHFWHIAKTRELLGQDCAIVCCMSGNFVQRGQAAIMPKHLRAAAAVQSGADLVLELSAPYSLLSAEGFAKNAVYILHSLGVVTHLSFGAEEDNIDDLLLVANSLLEQKTILETLSQLTTGVSYAAARERALFNAISQKAEIINKPNNILAVEYLKALISLKSPISPLPIKRKGAGHDSAAPQVGFSSASYIRERLQAGQGIEDIAPFVPEASLFQLQSALEEGALLTDLSRLHAQMAARLTRLSPQDLALLPDVSEGLEHRIFSAISASNNIDTMVERAKTRRYPAARIRRQLMCAYLGLTAEDSASPPPYARVLAMGKVGQQVLAQARKKTSIPIISKPAHVNRLSKRAIDLFEKEALAADLYNLALFSWQNCKKGADYRANPVIL